MARLCITLACSIQTEVEVKPGIAQYKPRERSFNFFINSNRKFYAQGDLDHWIDFAQGYLKENYKAENIRVSSIGEINNIYIRSCKGCIDCNGTDCWVNVLDFSYMIKSYDIE